VPNERYIQSVILQVEAGTVTCSWRDLRDQREQDDADDDDEGGIINGKARRQRERCLEILVVA
jgi:hypothetical protein